jgi:hypothetical protein
MYAGYIFATRMANDLLIAEIRNASTYIAPELNGDLLKRLAEVAQMDIPVDIDTCNKIVTTFQQQFPLTEKEAAILLLAIAASHSPSQINEAVIHVTLKHVEPAAAVEILVWLSILQLLSRLSSYYQVIEKY